MGQGKMPISKKFCEIFGVYYLLATVRKYDQPMYFFQKESKKNLENISLAIRSYFFFILLRPKTF